MEPTHGDPWADEKRFRNPFWVPVLKALGIRYRLPNHMRNTYATMLLMAGATPAYAAKQMGHSVEMFWSVYSKWLDDGQGNIEQAKLESFIGQNSPGTPLKTKIAIRLCFIKAKLERVMGIEPTFSHVS
ncbi:hypothetical protein [Comamonas sp. E6]|uniref:hypothetical protein n=1 Tax=Comamonas sp. E6 TaxID=364029 RepID=UPI001EE717F3|nr:hypothetical protein [Comamonas sp. E6]